MDLESEFTAIDAELMSLDAQMDTLGAEMTERREQIQVLNVRKQALTQRRINIAGLAGLSTAERTELRDTLVQLLEAHAVDSGENLGQVNT